MHFWRLRTLFLAGEFELKHVGRNSAKKMFNPRVVWCLAGTVAVVMLACYLLYPFVVVRYALFVFAALFCYLRRDLLLGKLSA